MATVTDRQLESIARGGIASLAGAGVAAVANLAVVVIITQAYPKDEAGILFSASSLFLIALALVGLGIDTGLARFLLRHVASGNWDWARQCLRSTILVTLVVGGVVSLGLWFAASPIAGLIGLDHAAAPAVLRVFAAALVACAVGNWALGASRAFANIAQTVLLEKLVRSVLQVALVLFCALTATGLTGLALAWVLPSALLAPVALLGLRRLLARTLPPRTTRVRVPEATREFWRFTTPRSIAQVAQLIIQRLDIILIAAMLSPAAAAVYTAATRFVPLGQLGTQAIQQVIQPRFTHLMATHEREALSDVFRIATAWNMTVAWPIYLVVASLAGLYLRLFGTGFVTDGVAVVVVMAAGMMIGSAAGPVDTILLMSGRSWLSLSNALVALSVNVVLCVLLIPSVGILGAAIAWSASVGAKSVLGVAQVRRFEGLNPFSRASATAAGAAFVAFGLPGTLLTLAGLANPTTLLLLVLVGGCGYAALLWWQRETLRLGALRALLPGRR